MNQQSAANVFDEMGVFWAEIADKNQTSRQTQFLKEQLGGFGGAVLDVACGTGRHILPLSELGFEAVGLDASRRLLRIAKQRSRGLVVLGDMRCLPFRAEAFTAAINMDTSFGYLPTEEADMQSLTEMRRVLRRDGRLVLDVFNLKQLQRKYGRQSVSKRLRWAALPLLLAMGSRRLLLWVYRWLSYPSFLLLQKRTIGDGGGWLCDLWVVYIRADGRLLTFSHRVRLYPKEQLMQMLAGAGFAAKKAWGDYEQQPFSADALRLILLSTAT
jgi:ubiquinone/menaquinone biosynthesis C-methylase UbiE